MLRWLGSLRCRLGRHRWIVHTIAAGGALTAIPRCERCARVDIDGISSTRWSRRDRRRWHRAVARAGRR